MEENSIDLKDIISIFEENEHELTDVPKEIVKKYGYCCLIHSLILKEQKVPKFDPKIADYIKSHTFDTIDSVTSYARSLDNDIDKLYAIFAYEALNIQFVEEFSSPGNYVIKKNSQVFQSKKAVCLGFTTLFIEMAKKSNIDSKRFSFKEYYNYSRGGHYNYLEPPNYPLCNHVCPLIKIDNVPYLSEPTWACQKKEEFGRNFNNYFFLIPLVNTIVDHFPFPNINTLLPFSLQFQDFTKSIHVRGYGRKIKTESHPFVYNNLKGSYLRQIYSCVGCFDQIKFEIFVLDKKETFNSISSIGISSYEVLQESLPKHPERCRFQTTISFPYKGFFKVKMSIVPPGDKLGSLAFFVRVKNIDSITVPVVYNPFHLYRLITISPRNILTQIYDGLAFIRFAIYYKFQKVSMEVIKLFNIYDYNLIGTKMDKSCMKSIKLQIPFDNERYENQTCVTFPSFGRYAVLVNILLDDGTEDNYITYYFDVRCPKSNNQVSISPIQYLCKNRKFFSEHFYDKDKNEIFVEPNLSCNLVNSREQTIRVKSLSADDDIEFKFKKDGKVISIPELLEKNEYSIFKWIIPEEEGEYHLIGKINDYECIDMQYYYSLSELQEETKFEKDLMDELNSKIIQNKSNEIFNSRRLINIESNQSKCCLLI